MKMTQRIVAGLVTGMLATSLFASPGAHGPNGEHLDGQATATAGGLARLPDGSVNVPKLAQRRMGVRTLMVKEGEYARTVALNGRVSIDPNAGGRVQAPFSGQIAPGPNGLPVAGQRVVKGQVLARLRPTGGAIERGNQAAQLAGLRANRGLLAKRVERLKSLEGVVPAKEIEAAQAELAATIGQERAVAGSISGVEAILAPASGIIASASVLNGQIVESRDVLFEIVDPQRMVIEALSSDVGIARKISAASLVDVPDAGLTLIGGGRSLRDGAVPINFRARGTALDLAVGQPVTVLARLDTKVKGIALPAAALARNPANETVVWIKSGTQRFIALPVEATALDARTVIVTKGLSPDNRVVVIGTSLINQIR
ncbi:efflux RND transporter periplasmic adaptor subunit [Telluria aromaticivorans]|uniref:HlyD family efflux transporter periplasmic adaptor subunit n=1 Tax=Telluria aromaticivorans TaxID=2725995 RepID=A0A7Y2JWX8_9BURK|nr:efflux RND transporter periplasmic adaptor subunit [Telluria aromaticivorans]NNG22522.1 HlyD family efflux transporter periplasmic adaptor subunit [Telluria aromaticivorans]